jgi:hypothetical protein
MYLIVIGAGAIPAIVADTTWPICTPNDLRQILIILLLYAEKNRIVRCERKDLNLNSLRIHFPILVIVHAFIFQLYDFRKRKIVIPIMYNIKVDQIPLDNIQYQKLNCWARIFVCLSF